MRVAELEGECERLRGALEEIIFAPGESGPIPGSVADQMCQIAEQALSAPLTSAAAERVARLEAVCEAATAIDEVMPSTYVSNSEGTMRVWIVVEDAEKLRAALAVLDKAGEG